MKTCDKCTSPETCKEGLWCISGQTLLTNPPQIVEQILENAKHGYVWLNRDGEYLVVETQHTLVGAKQVATFTRDLNQATVAQMLQKSLVYPNGFKADNLIAVPAYCVRQVYLGPKQ